MSLWHSVCLDGRLPFGYGNIDMTNELMIGSVMSACTRHVS
jgi:hypothetical protein